MNTITAAALKRNTKLLFALLFYILSFTKGQSQDTISKKNFSYGLMANFYIYNPPNNFYVMDYSVYFKYKGIGIFGGYSNAYNIEYKNYNNPSFSAKGFNAGLISKVCRFKNNSSVNLYIFENHYKYLNPNYKFGSFFPNDINKQINDLLTFNLRYKKPILKDVFFIEAGLFAGCSLARKYTQVPEVYPYNGRGPIETAWIDIFHFIYGVNISFSINVSTLFNRTHIQ